MDHAAIEQHGIAAYSLMERAGQAALDALRRRWPEARSLRIYCGLGNNAGDGYVVARLAHGYGLRVSVVACAPIDQLSADAARAARDCIAAGITPAPFSNAATAQHDQIIVDALFGTGLSRPLAGVFAQAVAQIKASNRPVLALDIPSGVAADTGIVSGPAIVADCTIAFVGLKSGYYLGLGPDHCGAIEFTDLQVPAAVFAEHTPVMRRLGLQDIRAALPQRSRTAHKGDNGRLLVIGGGPDMAGAVRMAGEAALRTGAGLVYLATHPRHAPFIAAQVPELIVHGIDSPQALDAAALQVDAIALGPGLGRSSWAAALCQWAVMQPVPVIIDADGLNWLATVERRSPAAQQRMLTPHAGEAGRLLGIGSADVQRDRLRAATELADRYDATVVLKGAGTLVCAPALPVSVCAAGNPGMASAGTGDVLTGIAGGVLVQCGAVQAAAQAAVLIHALAGDAAAAQRGERGLIATDLLAQIQLWANPR